MDTAALAHGHQHDHDIEYPVFAAALINHFNDISADGPLFTTDAADLFDVYLENLAGDEHRQTHNCNTCRRFFERFGGLVRISETGKTVPVMWPVVQTSYEMPAYYQDAINALWKAVAKAKVTGVFLTRESVWGTPQTGDWSHIHVTPARKLVYREGAKTAGQAMAEMRENYRQVEAYLRDVNPVHLAEAIRVFETESVERSTKFVAPLRWLRDLQVRPKGPTGSNMLWLAVATAPNGYCHPRAAVTNSLIEDIAAGKPFADIRASFNAKLQPEAYQRPKALPATGAIKAAEDLFAKMGLEPSLHRRFARIEELPEFVWQPKPETPKEKANGVFGHLKAKGEESTPSLDLPKMTVTWAKFCRDWLPRAAKMWALVPHKGNFIGLTTAVNADAPPILKWDRDGARNPFAWYVYSRGSHASKWGLTGGAYVPVTGITPFPTMYGEPKMPHLADGVIFLLQGAVDRDKTGASLFPEILRDDLHGVRSVLEAYSNSADMGGMDEASACGLDGRKEHIDLYVKIEGAAGDQTVYHIDRWE